MRIYDRFFRYNHMATADENEFADVKKRKLKRLESLIIGYEACMY